MFHNLMGKLLSRSAYAMWASATVVAMVPKIRRLVLVLVLFAIGISAQDASKLSPAVRAFVKIDAPVFALAHVRVIDGTSAAAREDQTIVVRDGRIEALGSATATAAPSGAKVIEMPGYTVIPGLVGMHEHLFYPAFVASPPRTYNEMAFSAPRLYLAGGVTSLRTTGSVEPYTDLSLKKAIDRGELAGPKIHVTGPYLEGAGSLGPQLHELTGPDDARKTVNYWADEGATSFKAYMHISRAELAAAIEAAHQRGLKVTGHLCSIGFREAAALGIDDLEHGLMADTEFTPGKQPDICPPTPENYAALAKLDLATAPPQEMIADLVRHHVAVTSTLAVFETFLPNRPPLAARVLDAMLPEARIDYLTRRARIAASANSPWPVLFKKELEFERAFVKAGGLLIAGVDPTGYGGVLPGFGDQREVELLVEAGFTPVEAIHIATDNGAEFLGEASRIGTLAPGKQADIVVIKGDPSKDISDIEKVEIVFKDGAGYDSGKLIDSVRGAVGLH